MSDDGQTLTANVEGIDAAGKPFEHAVVFDRIMRNCEVVRGVVLTGAPGSGKTTLLQELARLGYRTVEESARAIIIERIARGEAPRPEPLDFAREILRRDVEKYERSGQADWVFFDRGVVEALGMLQECEPQPEAELRRLLSTCRFHSVFVLPPWEAIYRNDSERDQTFTEAVAVHHKVVRWYEACGYAPHELPLAPVQQRATAVLSVLGGARPTSTV